MKQEKIQNPKSKKEPVVPSIQPQANRGHAFWAVVVCFGIPFVLYSNSMKAPFILDDIPKIVENPDIKSLSGISKKLIFNYDREKTFYRNDPSRPVTYLTFALNYHFGGLNPLGYHLVNVLLHSLNTVLVFLLARKIFFYAYKGQSVILPLLVALFFAVHPVNSSVVNYTFSRSDILATLFYLASILLFLKSIEKSKMLLILSLLSFLLAIFSKQLAVTLPAILLLTGFIFLSNYKMKETLKRIFYHIPFWVVLIAYLGFRYFYFGGIGDLEAEELISRYSYLITQPYAILRYLQMLLVPVGLCIDHAVIPANSISDVRVWSSLIALAGIIGFGIYKAFRAGSRIFQFVLFSLIWFFIVISPTSSFFPTTSVLVENRMYLSAISIPILCTSLLGKANEFFPLRIKQGAAIFVMGYIALFFIVQDFVKFSQAARGSDFFTPR